MEIALLGFGTVGSHFYELAREHTEVNVSAVLSRRPRPELSCTVTADFDELLRDRRIGAVVELIGGVEPAFSYVSAALRAGRHVVTANKQLMCAHYEDLLALARENGVSLRCTAAAGGGIPWLTSLARVARLDAVESVGGILNGTTNYILSAMTRGADYGAALREAQALGYAEADPTADVEGFDARRKLVLSANLGFGVSLQEADVLCAGISHVSDADVKRASERGCAIKLIARARRTPEGVSACVCPTFVPFAAPEAHAGGTENVISLRARRVGVQRFCGAGAGGFPTAANVLSDCLAVQAGCESFYTDRCDPCAVDNGAFREDWLLRCGGVYRTVKATAEEVFAAYERDCEVDPCALLARLAPAEDA